MTNRSKSNLQLTIAAVATLFGLALISAAFIVPPTGVIDPTVLTAYGETLTFVGALVGVDYHYRSKDHKSMDGTRRQATNITEKEGTDDPEA